MEQVCPSLLLFYYPSLIVHQFTIHFAYVDYCGSVQITVPKNTSMDEILYNNEQFRQQKEQQLQERGLSTLMKAQLVPPLSSSSHPSPTISQFCMFGGQILYSPLVDEDRLHVQRPIQEDGIRDLIESMSTTTTTTTTVKGNAKKKDVKEHHQKGLKQGAEIAKCDADLDSLHKTIRKRDAYLNSLLDTIRKRDADLDSLRDTIRKRDADLDSLHETIRKRDAYLDSLHETIRVFFAQIRYFPPFFFLHFHLFVLINANCYKDQNNSAEWPKSWPMERVSALGKGSP
jgi:hypothetical protein